MTPVTAFAGRRVALFGLGGSGLATALALQAGGAEILAGDDDPRSRAKAEAARIATADLLQADWSGVAALVLSPGVPLTHKDGEPYTHPVVARARAAGAEVIGDIELFCRERAVIAPGSPFVAITGTNGKSTTTALVAHILREAGRDVQMGGNIGTPVLALEPPAPERVHVIEMSSFQIDLTPSFGDARPDPSPAGEGSRRVGGPTVGVLLNITPDHLDRHGTMENYAAIKERVVKAARFVVLGVDDEPSRLILENVEIDRPVIAVSERRPAYSGFIYLEDGRLERQVPLGGHYCLGEVLVDIGRVSSLRGSHNGQNAAAAFAICEWLNLPHDAIGQAMKTFPGLAHRMEEVGRLGRILFVNDSKATNADSAEKALLAFDRVHWIIGGKAKEGGIEPLRPLFTKVDKAYLIGEATEAFAASLGDAVPFSRCGTLDRAVAEAAEDAARSDAKEPVVLLSPACASYDQYPNFEKRGDHFRETVRALPGLETPR